MADVGKPIFNIGNAGEKGNPTDFFLSSAFLYRGVIQVLLITIYLYPKVIKYNILHGTDVLDFLFELMPLFATIVDFWEQIAR